MTVPEIATSRLVLRGWRETDLLPLALINRDPEVMRLVGGPIDREASDMVVGRFVQKWQEEPRFGWWAAEVRATGTLAGFVGLAPPDFRGPPAPCVEIGWRLGRRFWGRGFATEAARAVLDHGFAAGLEEIVSFTVPANTRSRRVMERIGMSEDPGGAFDHPLIARDDPMRRHLLYRIRAQDREVAA